MYFREACMTLGEAAVEKGDFDQALNLFNRVESPQAAWNEAQVMRVYIYHRLYCYMNDTVFTNLLVHKH